MSDREGQGIMNNQNIIFQVTRRYMKRNRRRTAITFLGILLMVMLMTCVFVGKDTVVNYLQDVAELHTGSWHMIAHGLDTENVSQVAAVEGIDQIGYSARLGLTDFPASANEERPYLEVKAYSPVSFELLNIRVTQGRLPTGGQEIVITETALQDGSSVSIGDVIDAKFFDRSITGINDSLSESVFPFYDLTVGYGETVRVPLDFPYYPENGDFRQNKEYKGTDGRYTVVGFMSSPYFENQGSAGYPALTVLPDVSEAAGTFSAVMTFHLDKIDSVNEVSRQIKEITQDETESNNTVLAFSANGSDSVVSSLTVFIEAFFVMLIMAASMILIYNVFQMSYRERTKYLGMLSSVGATGRQKRCSVYYEAGYLLLLSLPLGILLGIGVIQGGMLLLKPHLDKLIHSFQVGLYDDLPVTLSVRLSNLLLVVGMSVVTVMLSALLPARKISKIGPVESIRGSEGRGGKRFRTRFGLLRKGKAEALLAVNSTSRCPHLTRGIVRSVAAFGVLSVVTLYGAQSVIRLINARLETQEFVYNFKGYDYVLYGDRCFEDLYDEAKERVESDSAVTDTKEITDFFGNSQMKSNGFSDEYWKGYEEILRRYVPSDEDAVQQTMTDAREYPVFLHTFCLGDEDFKKLAVAGHADMSIVGDANTPCVLLCSKVELTTQNLIFSGEKPDYHLVEVQNVFRCEIGEKFPLVLYRPNDETGESEMVDIPLTVAGFLDEAALAPYFTVHSEHPTVIINQAAADTIMQLYDGVSREYSLYDKILLFGLREKEGNALLRELSLLGEQNKGHIAVMGFDMLNMGGFEDAIVSIIRILAYCFTALISAVCLLNLYHSVKGRAMERQREIAMLRSMGMTERQLHKMLTVENILLLVKGWCIGTVLSGGFILLLNRVMVSRFGNITLPVPYGLIGGITAAVCAAMVGMTWVCYRFSDKESIVEDIRKETV